MGFEVKNDFKMQFLPQLHAWSRFYSDSYQKLLQAEIDHQTDFYDIGLGVLKSESRSGSAPVWAGMLRSHYPPTPLPWNSISNSP